MKVGDKIRVQLGIGIRDSEVVKINGATVWVRLKDGNVIKRHKSKHIVEDK